MRVSEHYSLGLNQPELEFLDVDIDGDTAVFLDPYAFRYLAMDWARECVSLIQSFSTEVLYAVRSNDIARARYLLSQLGESNEAHLGLSRTFSRGSGIGPELADDLLITLRSSPAVMNGLINDLEETVLFVPGVGHDRVSDMTVAIVRRQLIQFTQEMCEKYGMELLPGVDSGPMWDRVDEHWTSDLVDLPVPNGKLLLIPKMVVRRTATFDPGDYLNNFVLRHLQRVELTSPSSTLVQERRRGERFVTKKSIRERDGKRTKPWNTEATERAPEILDDYRETRPAKSQPPGHDTIAILTDTPKPDWKQLLRNVTSIQTGPAHADDYHRAVQRLLDALFYPALGMPTREFPIHERRKRIDINYVNVANEGFFWWLINSQRVSAAQVVVECKNYSGELSNPEFDQLTGRFSPYRGQFGLLCYRGFRDNKKGVIQHCRDAALDQRGFVIALDDDDLALLVESRIDGEETMFEYLLKRFRELI